MTLFQWAIGGWVQGILVNGVNKGGDEWGDCEEGYGVKCALSLGEV